MDRKGYLGSSGEVYFRGCCVIRGYYDDPEKTAEIIGAEGCFSTGDLEWLMLMDIFGSRDGART